MQVKFIPTTFTGRTLHDFKSLPAGKTWIYHAGKRTEIDCMDTYKRIETIENEHASNEVRDVYEQIKDAWRHRQYLGGKKVLEETDTAKKHITKTPDGVKVELKD
jgi:hypothetical protein